MWAGRSVPPRTRTQTITLLCCCIFLVVVDIEIVTSMSLDRLGIERNNELQSDKQMDLSEQKATDLIIEDEELGAVPAGGETELYVLLPSGSKSERDSVDKNTIESDDIESTIVQENGGDMIMMESQDTPIMQIVNLPQPAFAQKEREVENQEKVDETINEAKDKFEVEEKPTTSKEDDDEEEKEEEPIKQVFKNDKDIEYMDKIENESDKDGESDSSEDNLTATQTGDVENEADDVVAPQTMVELFADVVEEVEKEIENELTDEEVKKDDVKLKDEEQAKWEETVEKLEEKGSEKQKEETAAENETTLDVAASVIEELMPEEVVEAMAMAEMTDNSSEETDESEKQKEKEKEKINITDEKNQIDEVKPENFGSDKNEEENKKENQMIAVNEQESQHEIEAANINENESKKPEEAVVEEEHFVDKSDDVEQNVEVPKVEESIQVEENKPVEATKLSDTFVEENQNIELADVLEPVTVDQQPAETLVLEEEPEVSETLVAGEQQPELSVQEQESDQQKLPEGLVEEPQKILELESENTIEEEKSVENENDNTEIKGENKTEALNEELINEVLQNENNKIENNEIDEEIKISETNAEDPFLEESKLALVEDIQQLEDMKEPSENIGENNEADEMKETDKEQINPSAEIVQEIDSSQPEESVEAAKPETIIMQADELPIKVDLDENSYEKNKIVEEKPLDENLQADLEPIGEIAEEIKINPLPAQSVEEHLNESENINDADVHNNGEEITQPQEPQLEQNPNEDDAQHEENLLSPQLPQKTEEESEPTNDKETDEMLGSTMLTTIVQTPTQEHEKEEEVLQLQQQPEQQEQQQAQPQEKPTITQQDEMHIQDDNKVQNEQIVSELLATTQMTIASSTQPPQNVAFSATQDSVLNYINATNAMLQPPATMPNQEQQKQPPTKGSGHGNKTEDSAYNAQLRRYDGAQVWRIVVQSDRDRRLADELQTKYDGQLWKEVKQEVDYLLKPQVLADAEKHIRAANLSRIVLIDNLQKVIEVENPALDEFADADNEKGHRLTWHSYHRLADIHDFFDYLAKTYPEICAVETIGYSVEKRPLKVLIISNGNAGNPSVWIDGGMHAREWISPASVTYMANQIVEGWENLPSYMQKVNWYIHAVANPDGYEYTHTTDRLWRKNMRSHGRACPGVDLNRNFGYKWGGKGTSANPCSQIYRGSKAFSEPETFYISKFISNFPRDTFQAFLSFHSYGQYILYPWGYDYMLTADRSDLDRVARAAATTITRASGSKYTVGPSATTLYPAAGGSDDWAKGIANIKYTYTIEMGDTGRYGFILPANQIESNGKDAYTFVQTVARAISHDMRKRNLKLK